MFNIALLFHVRSAVQT